MNFQRLATSFSNSTHLKTRKTRGVLYFTTSEGLPFYLFFLKVTATGAFRTMSNLFVGAFSQKQFTALSRHLFLQKTSFLLLFWPRAETAFIPAC